MQTACMYFGPDFLFGFGDNLFVGQAGLNLTIFLPQPFFFSSFFSFGTGV
jgi:hypothetical protein